MIEVSFSTMLSVISMINEDELRDFGMDDLREDEVSTVRSLGFDCVLFLFLQSGKYDERTIRLTNIILLDFI